MQIQATLGGYVQWTWSQTMSGSLLGVRIESSKSGIWQRALCVSPSPAIFPLCALSRSPIDIRSCSVEERINRFSFLGLQKEILIFVNL